MLPVLLLPGIVLPAARAYGALGAALRPEVDAVAKELEIYRTPEPPPGYGLDVEIAGILREADARGWELFHLVGYSAGGAVCLAFTAVRPDKVASLALLELAWAGTRDQSAAEQRIWAEQSRLAVVPHPSTTTTRSPVEADRRRAPLTQPAASLTKIEKSFLNQTGGSHEPHAWREKQNPKGAESRGETPQREGQPHGQDQQA
ncbi:MAG TPA: alpha/beta fold hydrolase [Gaiellaceae bacterium]|nr:alpha/beta fold hydrolase [Gaiellaceae bacterium]